MRPLIKLPNDVTTHWRFRIGILVARCRRSTSKIMVQIIHPAPSTGHQRGTHKARLGSLSYALTFALSSPSPHRATHKRIDVHCRHRLRTSAIPAYARSGEHPQMQQMQRLGVHAAQTRGVRVPLPHCGHPPTHWTLQRRTRVTRTWRRPRAVTKRIQLKPEPWACC